MTRSKNQTCDIFFDVFYPQRTEWIPTKFVGRCVTHSNDEGYQRIYRLFRCSKLATVLSRTSRTIRGWEADSKIPRPRFAFDDKSMSRIGNGEERWYSEEQIRMMSCHQRGIFGDDPRTSKGRHVNIEEFFKAVQEDWNIEHFDESQYVYEFDTVVLGRGNVHI